MSGAISGSQWDRDSSLTGPAGRMSVGRPPPPFFPLSSFHPSSFFCQHSVPSEPPGWHVGFSCTWVTSSIQNKVIVVECAPSIRKLTAILKVKSSYRWSAAPWCLSECLMLLFRIYFFLDELTVLQERRLPLLKHSTENKGVSLSFFFLQTKHFGQVFVLCK